MLHTLAIQLDINQESPFVLIVALYRRRSTYKARTSQVDGQPAPSIDRKAVVTSVVRVNAPPYMSEIEPQNHWLLFNPFMAPGIVFFLPNSVCADFFTGGLRR